MTSGAVKRDTNGCTLESESNAADDDDDEDDDEVESELVSGDGDGEFEAEADNEICSEPAVVVTRMHGFQLRSKVRNSAARFSKRSFS